MKNDFVRKPEEKMNRRHFPVAISSRGRLAPAQD